jgi:hypothetical protein
MSLRTSLGLPARLLAATFLAFSALGSPVLADAANDTLDQQQPNDTGGFTDLCSVPATRSQVLAQTFTAGLSGPIDRVSVSLARRGFTDPGPITARITAVDTNSLPTELALGSGTIASAAGTVPPNDAATVWVNIPLTAPAPVTAGTQYALVLNAPLAFCGTNETEAYDYGWSEASAEVYAGGAAYAQIGGDPSWISLGPDDFAFKTYVLTCDKPGNGKGDKNHVHCGPPGHS